MLNLNSIMIGTHDPKRLANFYEAVLDKKPDMQDGSWYGFSAGSTYLSIGEHSEVKDTAQEPQRLMLCFESKEVKEEFERISKIEGVKVIKEPYEIQGAWIATLADPDGNYFQLMTPWESEKN
ncbi:MAG TPA: VOC family protein [Candidatus Limnocylindrales bacterium]|nr:VOC family protein [Candidatus Limnocylindrales bacterium]